MILMLLRLCLTFGIAFLAGKLVARVKLPSILGWLLAGMVLGPHAVSLVSQEMVSNCHSHFGVRGRPANWHGTDMTEAQAFRSSYHHHNAYPVLGDVPACIAGVRRCVLFLGHSCLSGLYFWRDRLGYRPCPGTVHCPGIQNKRTSDQYTDSHGRAR